MATNYLGSGNDLENTQYVLMILDVLVDNCMVIRFLLPSAGLLSASARDLNALTML